MFKNPTLTADSAGGYWLSVELQQGTVWTVAAIRLNAKAEPRALPGSAPAGTDILIPGVKGVVRIGRGINHRAAAAPDGGIWIVWQSVQGSQFDISAARLTDGGVSDGNVISKDRGSAGVNRWQPDLAVTPKGDVHVAWDACESRDSGYDLYHCVRTAGAWGREELLSAEKAFETRARLVADGTGRVWATWDEGSRNWGERYVPRMHTPVTGHLDMADDCGPLHAFRKLRTRMLTAGHGAMPELPMPAFARLAQRPDLPGGVKELGGFYERAELVVDGLGRPWVVYRHFVAPWVGIDKITHKQEDWGVYARCYDGLDWSEPFRLDIGQGDGMQRLSAAPTADGIVVAYATGRTDRRAGTSGSGIAFAGMRWSGAPFHPDPSKMAPAVQVGRSTDAASPPAAAGEPCEVYYGDLHRHTDLSLCNYATDGTMEDAYRYAIDVACLDFMGVTDHARDIADGDAKSLLWWRCRKEVGRHDLSPKFIPLYAYEHSRGGEDHNVVSLNPVLFPDTTPFPKLWPQLDRDTITIPHQTMCKPVPPGGQIPLGLDEKTWGYGDDEHRRLLEIYQGCRDRAIEADANLGIRKGHIMGFIASSDHHSTSASFAGVWANERTREAIFRAMQARRTFGATARIRLKVTMGDHWMGEQLPLSAAAPVRVEATGTGEIQSLALVVDGEVVQTLPQSGTKISAEVSLPTLGPGVHYFYVRLVQRDGNRAWASPIWVGQKP
jgi:hypothetical protein